MVGWRRVFFPSLFSEGPNLGRGRDGETALVLENAGWGKESKGEEGDEEEDRE